MNSGKYYQLGWLLELQPDLDFPIDFWAIYQLKYSPYKEYREYFFERLPKNVLAKFFDDLWEMELRLILLKKVNLPEFMDQISPSSHVRFIQTVLQLEDNVKAILDINLKCDDQFRLKLLEQLMQKPTLLDSLFKSGLKLDDALSKKCLLISLYEKHNDFCNVLIQNGVILTDKEEITLMNPKYNKLKKLDAKLLLHHLSSPYFETLYHSGSPELREEIKHLIFNYINSEDDLKKTIQLFPDILEFMKQKGFDIPIYLAVRYNNPFRVKWLVENNANLTPTLPHNQTLLHIAIKYSSQKIFEILYPKLNHLINNQIISFCIERDRTSILEYIMNNDPTIQYFSKTSNPLLGTIRKEIYQGSTFDYCLSIILMTDNYERIFIETFHYALSQRDMIILRTMINHAIRMKINFPSTEHYIIDKIVLSYQERKILYRIINYDLLERLNHYSQYMIPETGDHYTEQKLSILLKKIQ